MGGAKGQFNCPETTKKEKAGCYPAKLTKQKDGSGEPMSEYDSDAMNKVRKPGIKKARTKNRVNRVIELSRRRLENPEE